MKYEIDIATSNTTELIIITNQIQNIVSSSGIREGLCHVFCPHTTAGITINENTDPDVRDDIISILDNMIPRYGKYRHVEGNSPAHLKASLMGFDATIAFSKGRLSLGRWQGIYFCEFDGPRRRSVWITIYPFK